ncbi:MAG: right-handed parallel beta-helix repeat-containing protein [Ardenticatenaceae bacterium]|nr:right-handed parallel beta-helix repeat-containing protein [Ardenticatenaceae bacterium]
MKGDNFTRMLVIITVIFVGTLWVSATYEHVVTAQMVVGGPITQDTTWQGDVLVTDSVVVIPNVTLTILPGTRVKFQYYRGYREPERRLRMDVQGSIVAIGTAAEPIYFTSDAPDPQNGDWSMLHLDAPTGPARFHYVVFEFAQHGLNVWQASPEIASSVFRWNNWEGVYFESYSQPTFSYCQIYENGYNGLAAEQSNTVIMDYCEIWRNGTNGIHIDNSTGEVLRSRIHNNLANGLSVDNNGTLRAFGDEIYSNQSCGIGVGEGSNIVEVSNLNIYNNTAEICGSYTTIASAYTPPPSIDIGFVPEQSYALGYIPGDQALDGYMYVYPDDETRRIVSKIGLGLGLTWSLAWDGQYIWTSTLWGHIYKLHPQTGQVLDDFILPGSPTWGTPSQPWGMTFDDEGYMWLVDFAERKVFKIDLTTQTIIYSFDTPNPAEGGSKGIAWDGTYLNVMGWVSPTIYQMSKTGDIVNTITLDNGGGGGLAWDGEHFWVPSGGGRILKYDQSGHQVGWIYPASEGTWDMTWDGEYLWASQRTNENWPDEKIYQLEVLEDHNHSSYLPLIVKAP